MNAPARTAHRVTPPSRRDPGRRRTATSSARAQAACHRRPREHQPQQEEQQRPRQQQEGQQAPRAQQPGPGQQQRRTSWGEKRGGWLHTRVGRDRGEGPGGARQDSRRGRARALERALSVFGFFSFCCFFVSRRLLGGVFCVLMGGERGEGCSLYGRGKEAEAGDGLRGRQNLSAQCSPPRPPASQKSRLFARPLTLPPFAATLDAPE